MPLTTYPPPSRLARAAIGACALVLLAAFSSSATFEFDAMQGGGGGYVYTGSPTAHGMGCVVCHEGGEGEVGLRLDSDPPGLFDGGYEEGQTYEIRLEIAEEKRGLDRNGGCKADQGGCNRNLFVAELLSDLGAPAGVLCADGGGFTQGICDTDSGKETSLMKDGAAVAGLSLTVPVLCESAGGGPPGCVDVETMRQAGMTQARIAQAVRDRVRARTSWRFMWRAPRRSRARVHLYVGLVDGDGGTVMDPKYADYYGDATAMVHRTLASSAARDEEATLACAASRSPGPASGAALLLLGATIALLLRRARRRPRPAAPFPPRSPLPGAVLLLLLILPPATAGGAETSCDVITGASCLWGEGCDCDHDGYVKDTKKSKKYCHLDKCPLDADDKKASVLGKPSANNADGDGWTKGYDCDDNDPCVGKVCGVDTCAKPKDADGDGVPSDQDCDDDNAHIKPGAGVACCNCDVLKNPDLVATFSCTTQPCPWAKPPPTPDAGAGPDGDQVDAGSDTSDANGAPAEDAGPTAPEDADGGQPTADAPDAESQDLDGPAPAPDAGTGTDADTGGVTDATAASGPDAHPPPPDAPSDLDPTMRPFSGVGDGFVGGGLPPGGAPPPPSCQGGAGGGSGPAPLLSFLVLLWLLRARGGPRRRRDRLLALLLAAGLSWSCATTRPWQRQHLARGPMKIGANAGETQLEQHTLQYREGAAGGDGGGGGGCGCN